MQDSGRGSPGPLRVTASSAAISITRVCNSFQNLGPPIPATPELTVPGMAGTQVSSETGLQDAGGGGSPAPGKSGLSSSAHVLVHKQQESEGAGDLPRRVLAAVGGLLLWLT